MSAASAPDPGSIPLRPLTVGELIGLGFAVVRRHLGLLGPIAVLIAAVSAGAEITILSATGTLDSVATGDWINTFSKDVTAGRVDALPVGIYAAVGVSSLVSIAGALVLSGLATACASVDAVRRRPSRGAVAERLRGRIGVLVVVSVVVAVVSLAGSLIFLVPGLIAYTAWAGAAPATVMERAGVGRALSRSTRMTQGHRWRILGVTVLIVIIAAVIEQLITTAVGAAIPKASAVAALIVMSAVGAVIAAVTSSWVGAVIGLLYVDIRLRTENLGAALRAYAATLPRG
ncbi:MAG: hypothetical protein BGO26_18915 [Actinobacteria bacterium 69-20]|jgi:hypothetical protein|nr:MAG: hypothetical protein BGO26_18915 [Actinobacteria bacterium 69-20]